MNTYFRLFIMAMCFCLSEPVFAESKENYIGERENIVKDIQGIITLDKSKVEYSKELEAVQPFPSFNKENIKSYSIEFHKYVKSMLPYLLKKVKNNDVNGEFNLFHSLLSKASEIDNVIELSSIEKVSFDLCYENLKTEKILRACSKAISKYENKKLEMDVELNRFNGLAPNNLSKATEMAHDYSNLRRSVASSISE